MRRKLYLSELYNYIHASQEEREAAQIEKDEYYDLTKFSEEAVNEEIEEFIMHRGYWASLQEVKNEKAIVEAIGWFCKECKPYLYNFKDSKKNKLIKEFAQWFNQVRLQKVTSKYRQFGKGKLEDTQQAVEYLKAVIKYGIANDYRSEITKDRWDIRYLDELCRIDPHLASYSVNFTEIPKRQMQLETKRIVLFWMKYLSVSTIKARVCAFSKFALYLWEHYPEIESVRQVSRRVTVSYLIYKKTECRDGTVNELKNLKNTFDDFAGVLEEPEMRELFINTDIPSKPKYRFQTYSEHEQAEWKKACQYMEEQHGRALMLHMMLGTRISEVLQLRQDCITKNEGVYWIQIDGIKGRTYRKPITEEIKDLVDIAIDYTRKKYKNKEFVFVSSYDPERPMSYASIRKSMERVIEERNLKDDQGKAFKPKTHIFRHCYGVKLTEMHVPDLTIAELLGHANTDSVHYYRRMSGKSMAEEIRETRAKMDTILKEVISQWSEFRDIDWDLIEDMNFRNIRDPKSGMK